MGTVTCYLDANVLFALLIPEPFSLRTENFLLNNTEPLLVSDFASAEFASAVTRRVRMREFTVEQGGVALSAFDVWVAHSADWIEVNAVDIALATAYLRRLDLPLRTPDAIHIAAAQLIEATLVTFDQRMAASALALGASVATP